VRRQILWFAACGAFAAAAWALRPVGFLSVFCASWAGIAFGMALFSVLDGPPRLR
jgi:hypothetical protein